MTLREKTDAELASLIRHRQSVLKVATEDLALALQEQDARRMGVASYEAPDEFVPFYQQRLCACCRVPTPVANRFCAPCVEAHGYELAPKHADGYTTCERALAADVGDFERIEALPSTLRHVEPSAEGLAYARTLEVDPLRRSY